MPSVDKTGDIREKAIYLVNRLGSYRNTIFYMCTGKLLLHLQFLFFCILCFLFCFVLFYILFYFFSFPKFTVYAPYISNFILVLTTVPVAVSSVDGNQSSMTGNVKVRKEGARQKPSSSVALFIRSH